MSENNDYDGSSTASAPLENRGEEDLPLPKEESEEKEPEEAEEPLFPNRSLSSEKVVNALKEKSAIDSFGDESLRYIAKEIVVKRLILLVHTFLFIGINFFLYLIYYYSGASYSWYLWVLSGWGLGYSIHLFSYVMYKKGIERVPVLILCYHLFLFIVVNAYLLFIDWVVQTQGNFQASYSLSLWFRIELVSWVLVLFLHLVWIIFWARNMPGEEEKRKEPHSWIDLQIQKELRKIEHKKNQV